MQPGDPWRSVQILDETESTNAVLVTDPAPWRVVVAERQTRGRGRLGRTWVSAPGLGLAVSALVPVEGVALGWVPLIAGLALCDAIADTAGIPALLKWPNDVLLPGDAERKVAGILCEWTPSGVVVGVGVNVLHQRKDLPVPEATSLALAGGATTREALLTAYLRSLARRLVGLAEDPVATREAYVVRCGTLGRRVVVHEPLTSRSGVATGVDREGRLELRTETGVVAITAGDVVHVRTAGPA